VNGEALRVEIVAHTPHLNSVGGKESSSIAERTSFKANGVVPLIDDEHSHKSLIAVDDKVAAPFVHVLVLAN